MSAKTLFIRPMFYAKAIPNGGFQSLKGLIHIAKRAHQWHESRRSRYALAKLDDRILADVGISRAQVGAELRKSFWIR